MTYDVRELSKSELRSAKELAAANGWLIESTDELRYGFGDAEASWNIESLDNLPRFLDQWKATWGSLHPLTTFFAAIPFERESPFTVWLPTYVVVKSGDAPAVLLFPRDRPVELDHWDDVAPSPFPHPTTITYVPQPDAYAVAVANAVERMQNHELDKVVLGRRCTGSFNQPLSTSLIAARLHQLEPACTTYSLPLSQDRRFTGASPELLVSRHGLDVTCHPLAGTIATQGHADANRYAKWLLGSSKNRNEHRFVVEDIADRLRRITPLVVADAEPSLVELRSVSHLGSFVRATLGDTETSALELVEALHPTPAVGGLPREVAIDLVRTLEQQPRGFFAGTVGWMDANGDGQWWVAIRGIQTEGHHFEVWAGAGIVADSDPVAEREETKAKLDAVLYAVGVGTFN